MPAPRCLAELARREIKAARVERAPGVLAPVRLPEGIGGVVYRTPAPAHVRAHNPGDVFDCRLALALSDFSKILRERGVREALILSAWRPPPGDRGLGGPALRHPGALAVDIYRFGKEGAWLHVERDFGGALGAPVCGRSAPEPPTAAGRELRAIVCEAAAQHLFTSILTPSYDRAHKNHLHLEVTPGVEWELLR
jgi:hypothetical protein